MTARRAARAFAAFASLVLGCATPAPRTLQSFDRRDADVYLVPVGDFAPKYLVDLASYYEDVFGLTLGVTPPLPTERSIVDLDRKQLITQAAIRLIAETCGGYSSNPRTIYVGVTHIDMYTQGIDWKFTYSQRIGDFAIVTSSRTTRDPQPPFAEITEVHPGLRKLVTKTIGLLYYKKPKSSNPHSVLYDRVLSLDDLDAIDESTLYPDILDRSPP